MNRLRHNRNRSGFTLIELLIVIAIILILIAIALPNFMAARVRAVVTQIQGEIRTLSQAIEWYASEHQGIYPHISGQTNQHSRNGIHRMYNLTSPVPYTTSEVIKRGDPFQGNREISASGAFLDGPGGNFYSYGYVNTNLFRWEERNNRNDVSLPYTPYYAVLSIGPDGVKGPNVRTGGPWAYLNYARDPRSPYFDRRYTEQQYSPTNGSRSNGDIVRFQ